MKKRFITTGPDVSSPVKYYKTGFHLVFVYLEFRHYVPGNECQRNVRR